MKVLLTGGTGFIGSHVAVALLGRGHKLTILARDMDKIPALRQMEGVEMVEGSLTDQDLLSELVRGQEACVHVALNYTRSTGREVLLDDTLPTVHLADACAEAGVEQFLYTSSTAVNDSLYMGYGDEPQGGPITRATSATKQRPATWYGATKAASENYLLAASFQCPLRVNIIRPGYTFGNPALPGAPTQADRRFREIVQSARAGEPIRLIRNDGTQFIDARDLAKVYTAVLESHYNRRTWYGVSAAFVTWESVAREALRISDSPSPVELEDRGWSAGSLMWDTGDLETDFGLKFDAWEGIARHLQFLLSQRD